MTHPQCGGPPSVSHRRSRVRAVLSGAVPDLCTLKTKLRVLQVLHRTQGRRQRSPTPPLLTEQVQESISFASALGRLMRNQGDRHVQKRLPSQSYCLHLDQRISQMTEIDVALLNVSNSALVPLDGADRTAITIVQYTMGKAPSGV